VAVEIWNAFTSLKAQQTVTHVRGNCRYDCGQNAALRLETYRHWSCRLFKTNRDFAETSLENVCWNNAQLDWHESTESSEFSDHALSHSFTKAPMQRISSTAYCVCGCTRHSFVGQWPLFVAKNLFMQRSVGTESRGWIAITRDQLTLGRSIGRSVASPELPGETRDELFSCSFFDGASTIVMSQNIRDCGTG